MPNSPTFPRSPTTKRTLSPGSTTSRPAAHRLFGIAGAALVLSACAGEPPTSTTAPDEVMLHGERARMSGWSPATPLASINTPTATEGCPFITTPGNELYLASNRPGGFGNLDIYVSRLDRRTGTWGEPVNLGPTVNTASNEQCPLVLSGGREMVFVSDRPGGLGGLDLWMVTREGRGENRAWGSPVNLATLNSPVADFGPGAYQERGATVIYFNSNRPGGAGGHDLYMSTRPRRGTFSAPVPVTELNTPAAEEFAALSRDGREIFFSSSRPGGFGLLDLYSATREHTSDPWGAPVNLGPNVNTAAGEGRSSISWDGTTLFFHSNRAGSVDLYQTTRTHVKGRRD